MTPYYFLIAIGVLCLLNLAICRFLSSPLTLYNCEIGLEPDEVTSQTKNRG